MSETARRDPAELHRNMEEVWGNPRGLRALTIVNHTTLGLRFMATGLVFFLLGGVLAMLVRTQLAFPTRPSCRRRSITRSPPCTAR